MNLKYWNCIFVVKEFYITLTYYLALPQYLSPGLTIHLGNLQKLDSTLILVLHATLFPLSYSPTVFFLCVLSLVEIVKKICWNIHTHMLYRVYTYSFTHKCI